MDRFIDTLLAAAAQWRSDLTIRRVNHYRLFTDAEWPYATAENRRNVAPLLDLLCKVSERARKIRHRFDRADTLR